jgi:ABC-type transport system involved in multi-copper enzyme maturation permease subunit
MGIGALLLIGRGLLEYGVPALAELMRWGYFSFGESGLGGKARRQFNTYLRVACGAGYAVWAVGAASIASGGVTGERDDDTWLVLLSTPLTGDEIVKAKMTGAVWAGRWIGFVLAALALIGMATGSIHPIGIVACAIEIGVFLWFAAALGTYCSLRARTSTRALVATISVMILFNGGYLMCCLPFLFDSVFIVAGVTPLLTGLSLRSFEEIAVLVPRLREAVDVLIGSVAGLVFYACAAAMLTADSVHEFDDMVDRNPRKIPRLRSQRWLP